MRTNLVLAALCLFVASCAPAPQQKKSFDQERIREMRNAMDSTQLSLMRIEVLRMKHELDSLLTSMLTKNVCMAVPDSIDDPRPDRPFPYLGMSRDSLVHSLQGSDIVDTVFDKVQIFALTRFGDLRVFLQAYFNNEAKISSFEFDGGLPSSMSQEIGLEEVIRLASQRFGPNPIDSAENRNHFMWNNGHGWATITRGQCINYREGGRY